MLHFPSQACRCLALLLCVALTGCALEKYSFQTFGRSNQPAETYATKARGDELALIYADYVARLLEGRSTGARVTREVSDSSLAVGGAFLAATETLEISAETVAGIGVGMVIIRELQKIFNAGGRSEAFADAAYLIRQAQSEYRQYNPNPSDVLTENGAILVSRVDAAVHAARKSLNGRLPALLDLQQATQPMTKKGADRESSGTPQTMFNAAGDRSGQAAARAALQARVDEAVAVGPTGTTQLSPPEINALVEERIKKKEARDKTKALGLPSLEDFNQSITAIDAGIPAGEKVKVYTDLFTKAGINLNSPEFQGKGLAPTFNRQTLVEAYRVFPANRLAIFDLVTELKAKFPPPQPPLPLNP